MKISFLIPSYNHSKFIQYTLDSIVKDAKLLDYEIIVIDDGSTDDTRIIIDTWRKNNSLINIIVLYCNNKGVSATLNQLVKIASGEVIRVCASDDMIYEGSSAYITETFIGSNISVLIGDALIVNAENKVISQSAIEKYGGNIKKMSTIEGIRQEIVCNWSIPGPCFALKKNTFKTVGGYSEDLLIEDWDFFLRVAAQCSIKYSDQLFSYYRVHPASATQSKNWSKRLKLNNSQVTAAWRNMHLYTGYLKFSLILQWLMLLLRSLYIFFRKQIPSI